MAALTANRANSKGKVHGRTTEIVIADTLVIFDGALVVFNSSGLAEPLDHTVATDRFAGYAIRGGTGVTAANTYCVVERRGSRWLPHVGTATVAMKGKMAYGVNDNEVTDDLTAVTNPYTIGKIIDVDTSLNMVEVDLEDRAPGDEGGESGDMTFTFPVGLHPTKTVFNVLTARVAMEITNIDYVPDIAQGGALTATVVKVTGTDTPASGTTPMHAANAINLNGTAHTVQPITLTATAADLRLVAGQRIGFVESGAMTVGSGTLTIRARRL